MVPGMAFLPKLEPKQMGLSIEVSVEDVGLFSCFV
jgi:hypothetical protein